MAETTRFFCDRYLRGYAVLLMIFCWLGTSVEALAQGVHDLLGSYVPVPNLRDSEFADTLNPTSPRAMLMSVAEQYASYSSVPYIWGGEMIGGVEVCDTCRSCLSQRRHWRVAGRAKVCTACQSCGIDCSHFVYELHRDAGLPYTYLDTKSMRRSSAATLLKSFHLVDKGKNLDDAQPGDLLVHARHVVMLLRKGPGKWGDFIHVSRTTGHDRLGGIEIVRDADLNRVRGPVLRILRHADLEQESTTPAVRLSQRASFPSWSE